MTSVRAPLQEPAAAQDRGEQNDAETSLAEMKRVLHSAQDGPRSPDRAASVARKPNYWVQIAFVVAIGMLLVVGTVSYRTMTAAGDSNNLVRHTNEVLSKLQDLRFAMAAISSNTRRFVITGIEADLDFYRSAKSDIGRLQAILQTLTLDNPEQRKRLVILSELTSARVGRAEAIIGLRRSEGLEAASKAVREGPTRQVTSQFEEVIGQMRDEELRLLALRDVDEMRNLEASKTILLLGTLLGLMIAGAAGWTVQRNIRRRGRAEAALRGSEEEYRMLLDGVQDNAIFMMDPAGNVVSWNSGAERIKGYSAEEITGQHFSRFFTPQAIERGWPKEILRIAEANGVYEEQSLRMRKDGSRYLANVTFTALRDAAGNLRGFSEFSHDLNESKDAGAKYRGLLEAAPDAMVVVNQAGEIVLLNLQAEKQFGYRRDELLGQKVTNIIPEGFAERLVADDLRSTEDALAQQIGTGIELIALRKDGSQFPIELMLSPLESAEGILVTAAIRNISVRKDAEKHLAQMEGRYRGLLEAAPDAMVVVNQAGDIVLLNLQAEKQFGYRRDELLGQKVTNIIPEGFAERLVADDLRSEEDALAQQIGTGIELIALRKDGSKFPIEIMLSPLDSADGTLVTAAVRNITLRKAAEKHLDQVEGKYRGLLEAAPDAMVVVNQAGEIVLLNLQAEKQFGYRRDELLGQRVTNIIPEGFAERLIADGLRSAEDAVDQQIGTGIELVALRKDGSEFPIELMLSPLESAEGILVTAAIRDISVRKGAETHLLHKVTELNRSNEELAQFAYIASHDLQEPLRMVASYTQLLSKRYKGKLDADADEFIAFAVDGASRMQRLIQDLLTYSRVGTKGKELRAISSESAFQQAVVNLRGAVQDSGAVITHDPLPHVMGDEMQLIQLFQNLVGNAIKYQSSGAPKVHVGATNGGGQWHFAVTDNGLGIDAQYFDRIFGMFQRLHKREEFAGTGIGLAICKKIVERHGGAISVESTPGSGSTFHFNLASGEKR